MCVVMNEETTSLNKRQLCSILQRRKNWSFAYLHVDNASTNACVVDKKNKILEMRQQITVRQVAFIDVLHHRQTRGRWRLGLAYRESVCHSICGVKGWVLQNVCSPVKESGARGQSRLVVVIIAAASRGGDRWGPVQDLGGFTSHYCSL